MEKICPRQKSHAPPELMLRSTFSYISLQNMTNLLREKKKRWLGQKGDPPSQVSPPFSMVGSSSQPRQLNSPYKHFGFDWFAQPSQLGRDNQSMRQRRSQLWQRDQLFSHMNARPSFPASLQPSFRLLPAYYWVVHSNEIFVEQEVTQSEEEGRKIGQCAAFCAGGFEFNSQV